MPMYREAHPASAGDPPGAQALQKALLRNPKDVDALTRLAELHLAAGNLGEALLLLERAEHLGQRKGAVQNLLGLTYYQLGEPQDAGDALKEAVAAEPSEPHWHLNLAAHAAAFGQIDQAKAELQKGGPPPATPRGPADHPDIAALSQPGLDKKGAGGK
jgi:Flp pilus assembly protein TadD